MDKLIFATGNAGKMKEIREILGRPGLTILSQKEAGITSDAEENGTTFEANALIKARAVAAQTDALVLADDSGLEIDYLNGEPGVYSARYMGEDTPYTIKNQKILCVRHCVSASGWTGIYHKGDHRGYHRLRIQRRRRFWLRPDFLCAGIRLFHRRAYHGTEK